MPVGAGLRATFDMDGGFPMRPRCGIAVLALGCLWGAGCAARIGTANVPGGTGGATGAGTGGVGVACTVAITPVMPPSFIGLRPGDTLRVRAEARGSVAAGATWNWAVTFADGSAVNAAQSMVSDPALIDVVLSRAGSYSIQASFSGGALPCTGAAHFVVAKPGARTAFFVFRLTPPPHSFPPQQMEPAELLGGTPTGDHLFILDAGTRVVVAPKRTGDALPLPAYVRATETSSGLFQEGHTLLAGGVMNPLNLTLAPGRYDLLVVPDADVPPLLIRDRRPVELATMNVTLDEGVAVTGQLTDATGTPIAGAKLSLRAGSLPSTVGTSGATGSFSLRVRPGTYGVTIAPGVAMPETEFSIAATPGIVISEFPTTISLRMASLPTARIGLTVTGAGAGAKVLVETRNPVPATAMVEIGAGGTTIMREATVRIRAELSIAANGTAQTRPLPRGHYRATVFAAGAAPMATVSTLDDIDTTPGDVSSTMSMEPPVVISGLLTQGGQPSHPAHPARVLAIDDDAPVALAPDAAAPFLAEADTTGIFSLKVNPSRRYRLIVDPPVGGGFARAILPSITVSSAPITIQTQSLPRALLYAGKVLDPNLQPVGGTVVSAFCVGQAPICVDPGRSIAETVTTTDGAFRLALPDPEVP